LLRKGWFAIKRENENLDVIQSKVIKEKKHFKNRIVDIYDNNGNYVETLNGITSLLIKGKYPNEILNSIKTGNCILTSNYQLGQIDDKYKMYSGWFAKERNKINKKYDKYPISYISPKKRNDNFTSYKSLKLEIYDNNNILRYISEKAFNRFCDEHQLPYKALLKTLNTGVGCYTIQKCREQKYSKFKGWYLKKI